VSRVDPVLDEEAALLEEGQDRRVVSGLDAALLYELEDGDHLLRLAVPVALVLLPPETRRSGDVRRLEIRAEDEREDEGDPGHMVARGDHHRLPAAVLEEHLLRVGGVPHRVQGPLLENQVPTREVSRCLEVGPPRPGLRDAAPVGGHAAGIGADLHDYQVPVGARHLGPLQLHGIVVVGRRKE